MMQFHTETLRLVGGKRVDGAAPGVAVLSPPLYPARGRGEDVFLMVLDLSKGAPSRIFREVREATAQTFWATPGGVTAALRYAAAAANQFLYHYNLQMAEGQRCYGALSCAAVERDELFLVQAGPACACALAAGKLERYLHKDLAPLGAAASVEVRVAYLPILPNSLLVLASEGLTRFASDDALQRVLSLPEIDAVLNGLEQVGGGADFTALLSSWAPGIEAPASPPRRRTTAALPKTVSVPRQHREPERTPLRPVTLPPQPTREEPPPRIWEPIELDEEPEIHIWRPEPEPPARSFQFPRLQIGDRLRRAGAWVAGVAAGFGSGLGRVVRRALPGQEVGVQQRAEREHRPPPAENPRVMATAALGIPVFVAAITIALWFSYGSTMRRDQAFSEAYQHAVLAHETADPQEERGHWNAIQEVLAGMETNPEAAGLLTEAQEGLDRLDMVTRVEPTLLWDFGPDSLVRRIISRGQDLFVLDTNQQAVFQLTLNETGNRVVGEAPPAIIQTGDEWSGQRVGTLLDMAWNQPGGEWDASALVVLDAERGLWVYDPAWSEEMVLLQLGPTRGESAPVAMVTFDGRVYLLDVQANQIWRYWPREGGYPDPPGPYIPRAAPGALTFARDMAVDGSIYVLASSDDVIKYHEGEPILYSVGGVPDPVPRFVAFAVDPTLTDGPVYVADAAEERILLLSGTGEFRAQFRAAQGTFAGLQALTLNDTGSRIFFAAGGRLYVMSLPLVP